MVKVRYLYHYQRADGTHAFRYDNAPHYPNLAASPSTSTRAISEPRLLPLI
ncbi:DUF6516 family protein [Chloroflexota bacterium]